MSKRIYDYLKINDLKDMLNKTGRLYADKPAYRIKVEEGKYIYTHKEVRDMINNLGTALINLGLKGKRIAVIGENRYEWEIAYLSIVCGTGIVVPLDKSLPANELELLIERSDVEAIFYTKKYSDIIQNIKFSEKNKLKHLISMDNDENCEGIYSQKELIREGKKLIEEGNNEFLNAKINPKEMEMMLFTSGTTSKSKVVALSHENICTNLMDIGSVLDVTQDDVFLSILPIHHVFECTVGFLFSLYKGAETVFCDGLRHIVENLNEYHVTVMACVPGIYERIFMMIRKKIEKQGKLEEILENEEKYKNFSMQKKKEVFKEIHDMLGGKIKLLISGAAALDKTIEEKYRLLGLNLVQGYGLTETSPVVAVGTNKNYKLGSIGKTVPSVEAKLVDVNDDGIGELVVRGSSVMLGYYENEKVNKKSLQDGWFYTGDLAKIDEEGYIFICGRKKSVIVLKNGKNIFPEEMENLVNKIEGIKESFIFGKIQSNDENNIKINLNIVFDIYFIKYVYKFVKYFDIYKFEKDEEIYKVLSKKIKEVNQNMPSYKAIRGMILTEEPLIRTTTNKIKRQENLDAIRKLKD